MRPTHLFEAGGAGGAGAGVAAAGAPVFGGAVFAAEVVVPGVWACGALTVAPAARSVTVRLAVVLRPPARRSFSVIVARPPAAPTLSGTSVTERFGSRTDRDATVRPATVTVALPLRAWLFGFATSSAAMPVGETSTGFGLI